MAIKKVKLPNNTVVDINDSRISGVDSTPTSGSTNVVTSSGVYAALQNILSQIVNFEDVSTNQDGTLLITLSNGDTITVDLNHTHEGMLPDVTSTDNGKIMKVVSGAWSLTTESGGSGGTTVSWGTESGNTVPLSVGGASKTLILSSAKVTSLSSSSTDNQIPSAKCVYDIVGDIESLLATL